MSFEFYGGLEDEPNERSGCLPAAHTSKRYNPVGVVGDDEWGTKRGAQESPEFLCNHIKHKSLCAKMIPHVILMGRTHSSKWGCPATACNAFCLAQWSGLFRIKTKGDEVTDHLSAVIRCGGLLFGGAARAATSEEALKGIVHCLWIRVSCR